MNFREEIEVAPVLDFSDTTRDAIRKLAQERNELLIALIHCERALSRATGLDGGQTGALFFARTLIAKVKS